jgi:hypothetical protein
MCKAAINVMLENIRKFFIWSGRGILFSIQVAFGVTLVARVLSASGGREGSFFTLGYVWLISFVIVFILTLIILASRRN